MCNYNWEYASDGIPLGLVKDISIWLEFKNISIYQVNVDGTIGKQIKRYGTGSCWTDGEGVYLEKEEKDIFISNLPKDIEKFF